MSRNNNNKISKPMKHFTDLLVEERKKLENRSNERKLLRTAIATGDVSEANEKRELSSSILAGAMFSI